MRKWSLVICIVTIFIASGLIGCSSQGSNTESIVIGNQQQGISVSGQGKITVIPDISVITLGIQSQKNTVAEAQTTASITMDKIVTALKRNGIASKDIQTQYFSIQSVTRYDNNLRQDIVIGYMVTNIVTVKIRNLDNIGILIDDVVTEGGDLVRINNISFSVEDPTIYYGQARERAIADAKIKAEQMANFTGIKLSKPIYVSESSNVPYPPVKVSLPEGSPTSINPGEIEVSMTVQIIYAISK